MFSGSDGGGFEKHANSTVFYDPITETFTPGQDMNYYRYSAGCALFESAYHGGRPVVIVVGGHSGGGIYKPLQKTEVLDYTISDTWTVCKCVCWNQFC